VGSGQDQNGFAGLCRGGADRRRQPAVPPANSADSPLAGGSERPDLRRAVFFPLLEPARRPYQAAETTTHDGSPRQIRGCRPVLNANFLAASKTPCLLSHGLPSLRPLPVKRQKRRILNRVAST